jgi:copper chaperone
MPNVVLKVDGMTCNHCVQAVEGAVKQAGAAGKVNLAGKSVSVEFDDKKVSLQAIKAAIEDQGYDVL